MKPAVPFAKADQQLLRSLTFRESLVPPPGRVMFWHGHKLLGHGDVAKLGDFMAIPKHADIVSVSAADYPDVREWLG
jgi:hypothetical protein